MVRMWCVSIIYIIIYVVEPPPLMALKSLIHLIAIPGQSIWLYQLAYIYMLKIIQLCIPFHSEYQCEYDVSFYLFNCYCFLLNIFRMPLCLNGHGWFVRASSRGNTSWITHIDSDDISEIFIRNIVVALHDLSGLLSMILFSNDDFLVSFLPRDWAMKIIMFEYLLYSSIHSALIMNAYTNDIPCMPVLCQDRETGTFCPVKSGISVWLIQNVMLYVVYPHDTDTSWHVGMIPGTTEPCPTPGAISANLSPPHSMQLGTRLSRFTYIYIVQRGNHITYDIML